MYCLNLSFHVNENIQNEWETFMESEIIKIFKSVNIFSQINFMQIISQKNQDKIYSIQLMIKDINAFSVFEKKELLQIKTMINEEFGQNCLIFQTMSNIILSTKI